MAKTIAIEKSKSAVKENVQVEIGKIGIGAITVSSAIIGCWAFACLVSGMISSGGPAGLLADFITSFK